MPEAERTKEEERLKEYVAKAKAGLTKASEGRTKYNIPKQWEQVRFPSDKSFIQYSMILILLKTSKCKSYCFFSSLSVLLQASSTFTHISPIKTRIRSPMDSTSERANGSKERKSSKVYVIIWGENTLVENETGISFDFFHGVWQFQTYWTNSSQIFVVPNWI